MLRIIIVCLIAVALQISALPEYIENLERDLSLLPEEYQYLAKEFNSKRAADKERDTNAYCCEQWQHINKTEIHTRVQTALVQKTETITVAYQACNGTVNPTRPPIPLPSATGRPPLFGQTTPSTGCMWTPITKTHVYTTTEYTTVTYLVPNFHTFCAPEDYRCCPSYVLLNNNCVHETVIGGLDYLLQLGLIGGIGKK